MSLPFLLLSQEQRRLVGMVVLAEVDRRAAVNGSRDLLGLAIVEAFEEMRKDVDSERRAIRKQWAKPEKQLATVIHTTARMYGDL